jgi:hypothetical protein
MPLGFLEGDAHMRDDLSASKRRLGRFQPLYFYLPALIFSPLLKLFQVNSGKHRTTING